jgi:hypothetical protein
LVLFTLYLQLLINKYPCMQIECNLFHVYNVIQFFVSMYNDTTSTNNNYFVNQLQEEEMVNLT